MALYREPFLPQRTLKDGSKGISLLEGRNLRGSLGRTSTRALGNVLMQIFLCLILTNSSVFTILCYFSLFQETLQNYFFF